MKENIELESNKGEKYYPNHHMWTYCIFLGQFITSNGTKLDLGIYEDKHFPETSRLRYSNATVWGNEPWEYSSGELCIDTDTPDWIGNEIAQEVYNRAVAKGINIQLRYYPQKDEKIIHN